MNAGTRTHGHARPAGNSGNDNDNNDHNDHNDNDKGNDNKNNHDNDKDKDEDDDDDDNDDNNNNNNKQAANKQSGSKQTVRQVSSPSSIGRSSADGAAPSTATSVSHLYLPARRVGQHDAIGVATERSAATRLKNSLSTRPDHERLEVDLRDSTCKMQ